MLEMAFTEVANFLARQRKAGRYKANTARNLEAACARVATVLEAGHDTVGYVQDHLDEVISRYSNLNRSVGRGSLDTYRSRVARALEDFIAHKTDPQWQPRTRESPRRMSRPETEPRQQAASVAAAAQRAASDDVSNALLRPEVPSSTNALRHRFPLRTDFDVEILLPRDFNAREAKRVTAWISALASGFADETENDA